jgi:hypothetical protein
MIRHAMTSTPKVALGYWFAETVRLTAFPVELIDAEEVDWWRAVAHSRPRQSVTGQDGQLVEAGSVALDHGQVVQAQLSVAPTKIDWLLTSAKALRAGDEHFPTDWPTEDFVAKFDVAREQMKALATQWWPMAPALKRIAFGAILMHPASSPRDAYDELSRFVQYPLDSDRMSDFSLQLNRRRAARSVENGLQINRLAKWSAVTIRNVRVTMMGDQLLQQRAPRERYAVRCELDINTSPTREEQLPVEQLPSLFDELVELASEIAQYGDIS